MSHPKKLKLFKAWAKAMEAGASVDKPDYSKTLSGRKKKQLGKKKRRKRRQRRKKEVH